MASSGLSELAESFMYSAFSEVLFFLSEYISRSRVFLLPILQTKKSMVHKDSPYLANAP